MNNIPSASTAVPSSKVNHVRSEAYRKADTKLARLHSRRNKLDQEIKRAEVELAAAQGI